MRKLLHQTFHLRVITNTGLQLPRQLQQSIPRLAHQLISAFAFLLVDVQQFLLENIVGELRLDLPDTLAREIRLS